MVRKTVGVIDVYIAEKLLDLVATDIEGKKARHSWCKYRRTVAKHIWCGFRRKKVR